MKSDYTTNSHYITHTIAFWKVGRIHFLRSGVKGLMFLLVLSSCHGRYRYFRCRAHCIFTAVVTTWSCLCCRRDLCHHRLYYRCWYRYYLIIAVIVAPVVVIMTVLLLYLSLWPSPPLFSLSLFVNKGGWRATADNARLYFEDDQTSKRIGAWCATDRENQWLQIDLGRVKAVRAIATQGGSSSLHLYSKNTPFAKIA